MPPAPDAPVPAEGKLAAFAAQIGPPAPQPVPDLPLLGPWFTATYSGGCDGCGGEIGPGDEIRADGLGGWLCDECGADPSPEFVADSRRFMAVNSELLRRFAGIENPHDYHEQGDY